LIADAKNELATPEPELFKVFLLALMVGLRRGEIDRLEWSAFSWEDLKLHVEVTEHLALKSEDSTGAVDLDPELVTLFKEFHARSSGTFVIESNLSARVGATYLSYRCKPIFTALSVWLRAHGVPETRPIHTLRKEYGSQICDRFGIYAASRALRHSDIAITSMHYLDKRSRAAVGLGAYLKGAS
jgi:integrase